MGTRGSALTSGFRTTRESNGWGWGWGEERNSWLGGGEGVAWGSLKAREVDGRTRGQKQALARQVQAGTCKRRGGCFVLFLFYE